MTEILTESFCERCGTRYTFESARPRVRLKGVKVLSRGLKNFVLSDDTSIDEAMASARSETDREATAHQLDAFHKTFNFCMSCRQYTCPNCWNEPEVRCLSCAPLALPEPAAEIDDLRAVLVGEPPPTNGTPDQPHDAWPTLTEVAAGGESADATEVEPRAEAQPEVEPIAAAESEETPPVARDAAGKAAAQTAGLLRRFRPGQSLDAELDAYERGRHDAAATAERAAEPETAEAAPGPEPQALAAATGADVVEQPTWRITAPDPTGSTPPASPSERDGGVPLQANAAPSELPTGEPQWPARPHWPASTPAAGLPFLGRPAAPQGGIEALWAASNEELVTAPPAPGRTSSGVQPCVSCGLSLSATARFCRRCGTLQGR
ncbi:MAG: hypothetical protein Q7S35_13965 [Candidatus Limnocylindrales bacterium]|nr:hypothetical protein [Candidatus Limnocylindrales bacterium]